jgi:hypothetical protein
MFDGALFNNRAPGRGGGVRGGLSYGRSDDYCNQVAENPVHVHDLHATILHVMGLDHTKLTYRDSGRDFRLTDVHGRVVHEVLEASRGGNPRPEGAGS